MPIISTLITFAFESVTVTDSATRLTIANVRGGGKPAERVFITVEGASIRYRDDGSDPTSSVGHLVFIGDTITLGTRDKIEKFRGIRTGGTSATIRVDYER